MKNKVILFTIFTFVSIVNAYELTIGTNIFAFAFEDNTLSSQIKQTILEDLEIMHTPWTNRFFKIWEKPIKDEIGYLMFDDLVVYPCFIENSKLLKYLPIHTNLIGEAKAILSKKLSDKYKNAITIINTHHYAWNERTNFISRLSLNSLTNMTSGDVKNVVYAENITDEQYASSRDDIVEFLSSHTYYLPNMLGFSKFPAGFLNYPEEALWLIVPMSSVHDGKVFFDNFFCVWRNGRWYYWPTVWD